MNESNETTKQWMNVREVAEYLGLKPATIYAYICDRRIPYHKVPGSQLVRFHVSEVDEWMRSGRIETKEEYEARIVEERSR